MPEVTVKVHTPHQPKQLFDKVSGLLENSQELRVLDPGYSYECNPSQLSGIISSQKFQAKMRISKDTEGACVEIIVILPRHLLFFKSVIQKKLQAQLQRTLC